MKQADATLHALRFVWKREAAATTRASSSFSEILCVFSPEPLRRIRRTALLPDCPVNQ
ncbi:Uncharacterised protein [Bordetella pertussis]|nr:Uncharacterised protein [Bordetella pertussis]